MTKQLSEQMCTFYMHCSLQKQHKVGLEQYVFLIMIYFLKLFKMYTFVINLAYSESLWEIFDTYHAWILMLPHSI